MKLIFLGVLLLLCDVRAQDYGNVDEVTTASSMQDIVDYYLPAEEPGSGDVEPLPECRMSYIVYEKMYLRGVKNPNDISFNGTTFEECRRLCCYETRFKCLSFSHLEVLSQCFIMNVTQHFRKFTLVPASGHVHAELIVIETTTEAITTTTVPFPTPRYFIRTPSTTTTTTTTLPRSAGKKPTDGPRLLQNNNNAGISNNNNNACPQCRNGGQCKRRRIDDEIANYEAYCKCDKGFRGRLCEEKISTAGGFPSWIIALIVLGGIILILFLTVCIMYHVYRKKTGEYNVIKAIRSWAGRKRKARTTSSDVSDDYPSPEEPTHSLPRHASMHHHQLPLHHHHHTSPTTSVQSIHESVTSSATHSTMTSV